MRILVAEKSSFSEQGLNALAQIAPIDAYDVSQAQLINAVQGYQILVVRLGLRVEEEVIHAGKELKIIASATTGLDHIDLQAAEKHGITVLSLKGERGFLDQVYATAEHTMALLLSLIRKIPASFEAVKQYRWQRDVFRGMELNEKVIGIVGCGRLGTMVAKYAMAFGMHVLVFDPYQSTLPEGVTQCTNLPEVLAGSDVISIHVPLTQETRHMFSHLEFIRMQPGAVLINTSRGDILDEEALLHFLETGFLGGAALDVLHDEFCINEQNSHKLIEYARTHDNLIITPHIGGATQESVEKADLFLTDLILKKIETNRYV